jgi:hypothetical protein
MGAPLLAFSARSGILRALADRRLPRLRTCHAPVPRANVRRSVFLASRIVLNKFTQATPTNLHPSHALEGFRP